MSTGIYLIKNKENDKVYVGQSKKDIVKRWKSHLYYLRNGIHQNGHLQHSFNKYGENSFNFSVLYLCEPEECDLAEKVAIACFESTNPKKGYNFESGGEGHPLKKHYPYVLNRVGKPRGKQQWGVRRNGVLLMRSLDLNKLRARFKKEYPYETLDLSVLLKECDIK